MSPLRFPTTRIRPGHYVRHAYFNRVVTSWASVRFRSSRARNVPDGKLLIRIPVRAVFETGVKDTGMRNGRARGSVIAVIARPAARCIPPWHPPIVASSLARQVSADYLSEVFGCKPKSVL